VSDWRHRAVCREEDPELFFPIGNTGPALAQIEEAKAVCRRCPVMLECLVWAMQTGQEHGVWGGMSEDERRTTKRRATRRTAPRTAQTPRQPGVHQRWADTSPEQFAHTHGARILAHYQRGRKPWEIASALKCPTQLVRDAHALVATGRVTPDRTAR
jgi:Transcription factor WhiB.